MAVFEFNDDVRLSVFEKDDVPIGITFGAKKLDQVLIVQDLRLDVLKKHNCLSLRVGDNQCKFSFPEQQGREEITVSDRGRLRKTPRSSDGYPGGFGATKIPPFAMTLRTRFRFVEVPC
jgi:hypothetical protein